MMGIMKNALRERIRRKDIYVVMVIGLFIVLLCMSGTVTLSIDGVPVTEIRMLLPFVLNVASVIGGAMAVALSLRTIPNEYERKTSHLVWMRGISQWNYHGQLALANVISSVAALLVLYAGVVIFALAPQHSRHLEPFHAASGQKLPALQKKIRPASFPTAPYG